LTAPGCPRGHPRHGRGLADRGASVTTALGYADADGIRVVTGTLRGTLATERRGTNGFGYDEIFIPTGGDLTFAEMPTEQKNRVSHRRLAVDALRAEFGISAS